MSSLGRLSTIDNAPTASRLTKLPDSAQTTANWTRSDTFSIRKCALPEESSKLLFGIGSGPSAFGISGIRVGQRITREGVNFAGTSHYGGTLCHVSHAHRAQSPGAPS